MRDSPHYDSHANHAPAVGNGDAIDSPRCVLPCARPYGFLLPFPFPLLVCQFVCGMLQMELDRIGYMLSSYHRCRLKKLEKFAAHLLFTKEAAERCSNHEQIFLAGSIAHAHRCTTMMMLTYRRTAYWTHWSCSNNYDPALCAADYP